MALLKDFMCDNLRVRCFDSRIEMGDCAGKEITEKMKELLKKKRSCEHYVCSCPFAK